MLTACSHFCKLSLTLIWSCVKDLTNIHSTSCSPSLWLTSGFILSYQCIVLFITHCWLMMANKYIHSLYQFTSCYVHCLLLLITCHLPLIGSIPDQSNIWQTRLQRMRWTHCIPSSRSCLTALRVISVKQYVYASVSCPVKFLLCMSFRTSVFHYQTSVLLIPIWDLDSQVWKSLGLMPYCA